MVGVHDPEQTDEWSVNTCSQIIFSLNNPSSDVKENKNPSQNWLLCIKRVSV